MNYKVDKKGFYGEFGGAFIPEMMYPNIKELPGKLSENSGDNDFRKELLIPAEGLCRKTISSIPCKAAVFSSTTQTFT